MRYYPFFLFVLLGIISCVSPSPQQNLTASDIAWKDGNIAMALASLEAQCVQKENAKIEAPDGLLEELAELRKEVSLLKEQVERVYEVVGDVQADGVGHAKLVPYDPRQTVLQAKTVQEAIDEVMQRIKVLERSVLDDLGQPGPGLFEIPEDKNQKGGQHPPPNGGPNGPPGGSNGGPNGPPGGSGQGGQGGPNGPNRPPN